MYFQHSQGTTEYHRIRVTSRRSRNKGFIPAGKIDEVPSDTLDTMIRKKANTTYMSGHREREQSSASIRHGTLDQYLEAQQQYAWLIRHTLCSIKFQDMVDAIKEGWAIAISDGSHKNKWVTASWRIMAATNKAEQWAGLHVRPGRKDDQSDFRSEIGGTYAMAVEIELICKFFHISNGSVSVGSDCEAALYYIFDRNKKATATTNSFDLIMATRKVLDRLHISFSHRHLPAHQDISGDEMDIWGRANDDCDTDAKAFWKEEEEEADTLVTSTDLCDEPWSLWIQGGKKLNVKGNMYNSIHDPEAENTWGLRDLPDTEDIDVPARRQAAKSSNIP
jgi:hypothetical protein